MCDPVEYPDNPFCRYALARFHQWLTEEGRTIVIHQIGRVQMLMEMVPNIDQFKISAEKQKKVSIAPYLFDEMNQIID